MGFLIHRRDITVAGDTPYLTRYTLRGTCYSLHIFHRGDIDPDCHDHPWSFDTFPLVSYVEEVWNDNKTKTNLVLAGRWAHRDATYCHRVIGPHWQTVDGALTNQVRNAWNVVMPARNLPWYTRICRWWFGPEKIVTIIKRAEESRKWGFRKQVSPGVYVWVHWKEYIDRVRTWMES